MQGKAALLAGFLFILSVFLAGLEIGETLLSPKLPERIADDWN